MIKVYVAGALNADAVGYIQNMHRMIGWADRIKKMGFAVYVPCLDFLMGLQIGYYEYENYFENSFPWLEVSDCLFLVPGWEKSKGTKREIKRAKKLKIPIFTELIELEEFTECRKK